MSNRPHAIPLAAAILALAALPPLQAQTIQIKTLPVADGDQWRFFPSANGGLGGVSIALRDSLLDPFENPAKGSRVSPGSRGLFFGAPSFYSVSKNAGGGQTLPLGGIGRVGSTFGGLAVAVQQIDRIGNPQQVFIPPAVDIVGGGAPPVPETGTPSRRNEFAFATAGRVFERAGISLGASALWSGLSNVDGVDLLYAGSSNIDQHGGALDVRLGLLKEWTGDKSFEALVLHDRFGMTHDVTWADRVWDPNTRTMAMQTRMDHNLDKTNTWGMHLGYSQPLAGSAWRLGAIVTTNLMSHPKLPDYQMAQVMVIPRDPGHSAAYNFGLGVSKTRGLTRFGIDAIFEPIRTHTWGETEDSVVTSFGTIPKGAKSTENWFRFSNAVLRTGLGHEIPLDTMRVSLKAIRFELGVAVHSIAYTLDQIDHLTLASRIHREDWLEWTKTWGFGLRFTDLEIRYNGRATTGTGRPGIIDNGGGNVFAVADAASAGRNFLSAPSGATTLTGVVVMSHQLSVSLPIR